VSAYKIIRVNGVEFKEHLWIVQKALGKPIPEGVEVHHFDENGRNNSPNNLVVCQNREYHSLLHTRQRALEACGNPDWRKCQFCKQYDAIENLKVSGESRYHNTCKNLYNQNLKKGH
jgi:hypothetical protein